MSCSNEPTTMRGVSVSLPRGDTFKLRVELLDRDRHGVDVTSWEWLCQVRDSKDLLMAAATTDEAEAAMGVVYLIVAGSETQDWPVADYVFDVQATDESDDTRTFVPGRLRITEDVSR